MEAQTQVLDLNALRAQLAAKLQDQQNTLPPPNTIRIKPIVKEGYEFPNGKVLETIEAVVLGVHYINAYYTKTYRAGEIETPPCWANSANANDITPSELATKIQAPSCIGCPHNEFGSKGAGKACKNMIRLALVPPDSDENTIPLMLDLPPTSTKSFLDTYRKLGTLPVQTVIMKFELDPSVTYPKTITSLLSPAPDAIAPFIIPLMEKAQPGLARGFDYD
jgi:hypothetical protein